MTQPSASTDGRDVRHSPPSLPPSPLPSSTSPSFRAALLAGALAGTTVDLSLFPLDTLKTRLQSSAGFFPSGGFSGIYRGVGSALVGSAPGAAFFFCTYEAAKDVLGRRWGSGGGSHQSQNHGGGGASDPWTDAATHMIAASLGEVAACAVRVPTEVVKQRAQAGHHGGSSSRALLAILSRGSAKNGGSFATVWRELYRGWGITVFREVPFTVIQFPLWEALKRWGRERRRRSEVDGKDGGPVGGEKRNTAATGGGGDVSAVESAVYGSASGAVAAALTTPLDVLKTRVMLSRERVSVATLVARMAREEGLRPFFAGVVPRVTWISIGGAIFLGSYQWAINTMHGMS